MYRKRQTQFALATCLTLSVSIGIFSLTSEPSNSPELTLCVPNAAAAASYAKAAAPGFIDASDGLRDAIGSLDGSNDLAIETLAKFRSNFMVPAHEKQLAAYALARRLEKRGNPEDLQAIPSLFAEAAGYQALNVRARLHGAEAALRNNDEAKIQEILAPLLPLAEQQAQAAAAASATDESGTRRAQPVKRDLSIAEPAYRLAESYYRVQDFPRAQAAFAAVTRFFGSTEYGTGANYYQGKIALDRDGDAATAVSCYRRYLAASPGGKFAMEAVSTLRALSSSGATAGGESGGTEDESSLGGGGSDATPGGSSATPGRTLKLTKADHDLIANALYRAGRYQEALDEWRSAGVGHIRRAICLMRLKRRAEAVEVLLASIKANPKEPLISDVVSLMCGPLTTAESAELWKKVAALNPACGDEALYNVAKRVNLAEGAGYYAKLVASYPNSELAPDAYWFLIWNNAKKGYAAGLVNGKPHFAKALALAGKCRQGYPESTLAPQWSYWEGKLHEALGQKQQALAAYKRTANEYPGDYYSYRAEHRYNHLKSHAPKGESSSSDQTTAASKPHSVPDRGWTTHPGRQTPVANWQWPDASELFSWKKMPQAMGVTPATLCWLKQYDEAVALMSNSTPPEMKAWLYLKAGNPMSAVTAASLKLVGTPLSRRWEFAYPLAYSDEVARQAKLRGLDPLWVHALIRQESKYNPNALSKSNAMGLMQLLVGTAYGVAKHNSIALSSKEQIFEPSTNIKLGCAYLAYVLKGKEGNCMLATASYNGGPNAVAKWLRQFRERGLSDFDIYVEDIAFKETRLYVKRVFAHYWNYERIYPVNR